MMSGIRNYFSERQDLRRILTNVVSLSSIEVINKIIPLITLPYLTRVFGPALFGIFIFAQAIIAYFKLTIDFGFDLSATKRIAECKHDSHRISDIYSRVIAIKVLLLVLCFAILNVLTMFQPFAEHRRLYLYTFLYLIGDVLFPVWLFLGLEKMKFIAFANFIIKLVFTALIFVFIKEPSDYIKVPLITFLGYMLAAAASQVLILGPLGIRYTAVNVGELMETFRDSFHYFLSRIATTFFNNSNTVMLGLSVNPLSVAYYGCAEKVYNSFLLLIRPINDSLYPYMSRTRNVRFFKKIFWLVVVANSLLWGAVLVFSKHIILLLFGQDYSGGVIVLRILAVAGMINVPSILLGFPLLGALDHKKIANNSIISSSIFHLIMLLVCFSFLRIELVACIFVVTQLLIIGQRIRGVSENHMWSSGESMPVESKPTSGV